MNNYTVNDYMKEHEDGKKVVIYDKMGTMIAYCDLYFIKRNDLKIKNYKILGIKKGQNYDTIKIDFIKP